MNETTTPWLTLGESSAYAKTSAATLRRELRTGRLKGHKIGGRRVWRLRAADVDAWLEGGSAEATRTVRS